MLEGAKLIGAGAATIALAGAAVGIGNVFSSLIHSVARNPSLSKQLYAILKLWFYFNMDIYVLLILGGLMGMSVFHRLCHLVDFIMHLPLGYLPFGDDAGPSSSRADSHSGSGSGSWRKYLNDEEDVPTPGPLNEPLPEQAVVDLANPIAPDGPVEPAPQPPAAVDDLEWHRSRTEASVALYLSPYKSVSSTYHQRAWETVGGPAADAAGLSRLDAGMAQLFESPADLPEKPKERLTLLLDFLRQDPEE